MYRSRVKHTGLGLLLIMKLEHVKKRYLYSRFNFSYLMNVILKISDTQNPRFLNFSYKGETRDPQRIFKNKMTLKLSFLDL